MENTTTSQTDGGGSDSTLITEQVRQGAQQVAEGAQQVAGQVADTTQQVVSQVAEGARSQAQSLLDTQKGQATQTLHQVHTALSQTSQNLRNQNQNAAAGLVDTAAGKLQDACQYLESRSTGQLIGDLEDVARSNAPVFLGGAFALGILAARFLKSSTPSRASKYSTSYATPYQPVTAYPPVEAYPPATPYPAGTEFEPQSSYEPYVESSTPNMGSTRRNSGSRSS